MGEEVISNAVVAPLGDKSQRVENALVEVPPVEDWVVALRLVKRYTEVIDDRVDYLLRDSHLASGGSEDVPPPSYNQTMPFSTYDIAGGSLKNKAHSPMLHEKHSETERHSPNEEVVAEGDA